ncbi:phospholipase D-like domain-containing protein [Bacillus mycoides]|uniref:phospholipase D-like domain-containing protein n=1 Tax=Bacillus mycoides TaxID=1405 RepID=UPI000B4ABE60|nr:phospholipase D-like domain-containing protein [Bacillus mycoides]
MSTEVFFARPGSNTEISDRVVLEIKYAKKRVLVAMAYFSDENVINILKETKITKRAIINRADKNSTNISDMFEAKDSVTLGDEASLMHHKFLVVDDVLWIGSYNFSNNAKKYHWENMLRITDSEIVNQFVYEFDNMFRIGKALTENPSIISKTEMKRTDNRPFYIFECASCSRKLDTEISEHKDHFQIGIDIIKKSVSVCDHLFLTDEFEVSGGTEITQSLRSYELEKDEYMKNKSISNVLNDYNFSTDILYKITCSQNYGDDICDCCEHIIPIKDLTFVNYIIEEIKIINEVKNIDESNGEIIVYFQNLVCTNGVQKKKDYIASKKFCLTCLYGESFKYEKYFSESKELV